MNFTIEAAFGRVTIEGIIDGIEFLKIEEESFSKMLEDDTYKGDLFSDL